MSERISIDDFPPHIRERLEHIARGESLVVVDKERPVAEIRPMPKPRTPEELAAIFESLPHLTPEEAEDFGRDLEEIRKSAGY
jgi:antitoxin (DNA-binding transcriptional repressor) of toxin-antitoxin stability system